MRCANDPSLCLGWWPTCSWRLLSRTLHSWRWRLCLQACCLHFSLWPKSCPVAQNLRWTSDDGQHAPDAFCLGYWIHYDRARACKHVAWNRHSNPYHANWRNLTGCAPSNIDNPIIRSVKIISIMRTICRQPFGTYKQSHDHRNKIQKAKDRNGHAVDTDRCLLSWRSHLPNSYCCRRNDVFHNIDHE